MNIDPIWMKLSGIVLLYDENWLEIIWAVNFQNSAIFKPKKGIKSF